MQQPAPIPDLACVDESNVLLPILCPDGMWLLLYLDAWQGVVE